MKKGFFITDMILIKLIDSPLEVSYWTATEMNCFNTRNFDLIALIIEKRWHKHKLLELELIEQHITSVYTTDNHQYFGLLRLAIRLEELLFERPLKYTYYDFESHIRHIMRVKCCLEWRYRMLEYREDYLKQHSTNTWIASKYLSNLVWPLLGPQPLPEVHVCLTPQACLKKIFENWKN